MKVAPVVARMQHHGLAISTPQLWAEIDIVKDAEQTLKAVIQSITDVDDALLATRSPKALENLLAECGVADADTTCVAECREHTRGCCRRHAWRRSLTQLC